MYFAPCAARAPLIAASSVFQRSSWKFDHDTPTVTSFATAAKETTLADASNAAPSAKVFNVFTRFLPSDSAGPGSGAKAPALQPKPDDFRERHNGQGRGGCQCAKPVGKWASLNCGFRPGADGRYGANSTVPLKRFRIMLNHHREFSTGLPPTWLDETAACAPPPKARLETGVLPDALWWGRAGVGGRADRNRRGIVRR